MTRALVALAGVLLSHPQEAHNEPVVREAVDYYDISGTTARQLRAAINRAGPVTPGGKRGDGETRFNFQWQYEVLPQRDPCRLTKFIVFVDLSTTLPRWSGKSQSSSSLVQRWEKYLAALMRHEAGHKEIGLRAAAAVQERMTALPDQPTCADLERAIEEAAKEVLKQHDQDQDRYDTQTRNGQLQGVRFP